MTGFTFLAEESEILLYAGALGLELGVVYDVFRMIRRVWKCSVLWTSCMDLLFWGFTASRTFYIMHRYSNGTLRWFAVLGIVTILFLYMKICSKYIVRAGVFVLSFVRTAVEAVKKFLTKVLKLSIIKLTKRSRKGELHGKKSCISDEIL